MFFKYFFRYYAFGFMFAISLVVIEPVIAGFLRGDFERYVKSYENFLGILPNIIAITTVVVGVYSVIWSFLTTLIEKEMYISPIVALYIPPLALMVLLWILEFSFVGDTIFRIVPEFGEMWKRFPLWGSFIDALITYAVYDLLNLFYALYWKKRERREDR